ncbi:MAG: hypothetical protein A2017_10560 [Lentisphaerae bacterium GWF2_44_16]|nr:MAG: hypothetical protein A2017_10560 [Lentisphaerae bacterium GWF2_44_16]
MATYNTHSILSQDVRKLLEGHPLTRALHPTHFGMFKKSKGCCSRPDGIDTHVLILCVGGQGVLEEGNRKSEVSANHLLLIPAGCPHAYGAAPGMDWSLYWTHFAGDGAEFYFSHFTKGIFLSKCPDAVFNKALSIFRDYHSLIYNNIKLDSLVKASQLLGYLLSFLFYSDLADTASEYSRKGVERAIEMMTENIESSLTLMELAGYSGLSKPHFSFLFKKTSGFSPIEYFNILKMRRACHYLDSTSMNIGEVSEKIGIDNQHYFSRLFSKVMGISPRDYRKLKTWYNPPGPGKSMST